MQVSEQLSLQVLRKLPKAELHRHLDGSVRVKTILELAKEQNVILPTFDEEELKKIVCVKMECESLMEYLRGFEITLKVLQKPYALTRVMYEVCEDAVNDGVRYLEVRFSPILHVQEGLSLTGVMEAVTEGLIMAEYNLTIKVGIIVCGMRHMSAKITKNLAEIAWRYRHKGVLGFDLAGPEDGFSSKDHKEAFDLIRAKYINVTLHSGEAAGPQSIQDSIRYCGAHRIGHGTRLGEDPELMQYVIDRRIALECCLTSNVQTKAIDLIEKHPIKKYFDAGVIVVPCCDNTTVSSVTLTGEYYLLQKLFNFTVEEIVRMIDYGFSAAFIPESEKKRFRAGIQIINSNVTGDKEVLRSCVKTLKEEGYSAEGTPSLVQVKEPGILLNSHYYDDIGVDISSLIESPSKLPIPIAPLTMSSEITLDMIRDLPKSDLHTRFDGSVSIATLWKEIQDAGVDIDKQFGIQCTSYEEFKQVIQPMKHTPETINLAKRIQKTMLQTEPQLERAVHDIFKQAKNENVMYMEIVLRPKTHTKSGLSTSQVVDIILRESKKMSSHTGVKFGLILYVSMNADDPIDFRSTAEMAVQYKGKGVVGCGGNSDCIPQLIRV